LFIPPDHAGGDLGAGAFHAKVFDLPDQSWHAARATY